MAWNEIVFTIKAISVPSAKNAVNVAEIMRGVAGVISQNAGIRITSRQCTKLNFHKSADVR